MLYSAMQFLGKGEVGSSILPCGTI